VKNRAVVNSLPKQNDAAERSRDTMDPIQNMMNRDFQKRQKVHARYSAKKVNPAGPSSTASLVPPTGGAGHQLYRNDRVEASGKMFVRKIGGEKWVDPSLAEWPENDFRLFVGDLGSEVDDEMLSNAFNHYASFNKAKVVRDKKSSKSKGFGFVSFADGIDLARCLREMNGKHIGIRPCKLKKSEWKQRGIAQSRAHGPKGVVKTKFRKNKKHLNF
jgi:RNA recognition motif-containing protein